MSTKKETKPPKAPVQAKLMFPDTSNDQVKDVTVELVMMTPEMADELLEQNTHNRKTRERSIDEYVEALQLGDWQFNGDPVRIANGGRLLDGQHRLMAISEANVTIPMVLIRGLTDKTQMTMDVGVKRSYSDHLQLNGEFEAPALAALISSYKNYLGQHGKVNWVTNTRARGSIAQLDRLFTQHPGLREASQVAKRLYDRLRVSRPAIGIAYYVMSDLNLEDCDFFWERMVNGDGLDIEGPTQPILKLREYFNNKHQYDHRKLVPTLGAIFKTWNAYREGRELKSPVPRFGGANPERFPWPK